MSKFRAGAPGRIAEAKKKTKNRARIALSPYCIRGHVRATRYYIPDSDPDPSAIHRVRTRRAERFLIDYVAMKLNLLRVVAALYWLPGLMWSQSKPAPPKLDLVFNLHLELGKPTDVGKIGPAGSRRVVP